MADDYKPILPEGVTLPAGASINTDHADFKALTAVAREEGWSQSSFSKILGLEVSRSQRATVASPTPAPAPAVEFDKMTSSQKFAYVLANGKRTR
jgi:hypothetical protein